MLAALFVGLWLGERGRRQVAERRETTGFPLAAEARRLPTAPDSETHALTVGSAAVDHQFSEDTIRKGVERIQAEAQQLGRPLSAKEARAAALSMLMYGGSEHDADLPELGV